MARALRGSTDRTLACLVHRGPVAALSLCLLLFSAVLLSACSGTRANIANRDSSPPAVPVTAATVVQKTVPVQIHAIGNVEAYSTVPIWASFRPLRSRSI